MISLEMAKKLKDAGLEWKSDVGDFYWAEKCDRSEGILCVNQDKGNGFYSNIVVTWLPRLDQLLAEIVKNNWGCRLSVLWIEDFPKGYECLLSRREEVEEGKWEEYEHCFDSPDSPEEAAAQALLWILNQK